MLYAFFWIQLAFHMLLFFMNVAAIFVLPFVMLPDQWYLWAPLETYLVNLIFSSNKECVLTKLENKVRVALGWRPIGGFFGHYFLKPFKRKEAVVN